MTAEQIVICSRTALAFMAARQDVEWTESEWEDRFVTFMAASGGRDMFGDELFAETWRQAERLAERC